MRPDGATTCSRRTSSPPTAACCTASADENEELFWGLRGGGGNFGVVTSFEYRLHEIGPIIYGGMLVCPPDRAGEVLRFLRDYMKDAPEDLGCAAAFVSAPPEPFVPAEMHFAPVLGIVICWTGSMEEGERVSRRSARSPPR